MIVKKLNLQSLSMKSFKDQLNKSKLVFKKFSNTFLIKNFRILFYQLNNYNKLLIDNLTTFLIAINF